MTHADDHDDIPPGDGPFPGDRARRDLDEDAAWREIVANYGEEPSLRPGPGEATPDDASSAESAPSAVEPGPPAVEPVETSPRRDVFDRSYLDSQDPQELNTRASWDDEGHFVPPPPPPLPQVSPRRKAAWAGLFGGPALMLVMIVFGWDFPTWVMGLLVTWFVGGFLYLVATMPRSRGDGWSGDDGAVV
jgi:hypothetical protein